VSGLVTVSANASDADGTVVSLKLDLPNGTSVDANNSASLSTTWDSTTVPDASAYVIRATATDNLGAISVATVTIAVDGPTTRDLPATDVPKPIPDRDFLGVSSVIDVPAGLDILNVTVDVAITHPAYGELSIQLIGPNSETVVLHNVLIGESGNFVLVGFDISSNFALGSPAAGQWKLFVQDVSQGFTGTIDLFALHIRSSH
jgi:subtilisin-like proprotein convertase family protein